MKVTKFINRDKDGNKVVPMVDNPATYIISFTCKECGHMGVGRFMVGIKHNKANKCPGCKAAHLVWGNTERAEKRLATANDANDAMDDN
jgi:predicted RNA-binding Zn-ribbon protein involved in translation (DUF1610 family)